VMLWDLGEAETVCGDVEEILDQVV
jgi:hypothetical protein